MVSTINSFDSLRQKATNLFRSLLVLVLFICCTETASQALTGLDAPLIVVRIPQQTNSSADAVTTTHLTEHYPDGSQILRIDPDGSSYVLTKDFLSAQDPAVSFDGLSILFAGKRSTGEKWQIWRMSSTGTDIEQVTNNRADTFSPLHIGDLFHLNDKVPVPRIAYVATEHGWLDRAGVPLYSLYSSNLDGTDPRRVSFNLFSDVDPDVLDNGRLVYSSQQPNGQSSGAPASVILMAVNIDGTDLALFTSPSQEPRPLTMVRVAPTGNRVYYIEGQTADHKAGGDLAYTSRRRPLHSKKLLATSGKGYFHSPCPLPDGRLLASYRPNDKEPFALYEIDPENGKRKRLIYTAPDYHHVDAQWLGPHPKVQGRSSIVGFRFKDSGVFYALSVYISEHAEINKTTAGGIQQVRVIEGLQGKAAPAPNSATSRNRILGVAPVEEDGSFHVRVPAKTPLTFQLLDEQGMSIAGQHSWSWVMPGESRLCIGCHEDRELVPPNRLAQAILKPEVALLFPPEDRRSIDFIHGIAPILAKYCSSCHDDSGAKPLLNDTETSYTKLLQSKKAYLVPGSARQSLLLKPLLHNRTTITTNKKPASAAQCAAKVSDKDWALLVEWLDLGAQYDSPYNKDQ